MFLDIVYPLRAVSVDRQQPQQPNNVINWNDTPTLLMSQRARTLRVFERCRYRYVRTNHDGQFEWICNEGSHRQCNCRILTIPHLPYEPLPGQDGQQHNHIVPELLELLAHAARDRMRERAQNNLLEPPQFIATTSLLGSPIQIQTFLPSQETLRRSIHRQRAASTTLGNVNTHMTHRDEPFVMYDSGSLDEERIIIYGTEEMFNRLQIHLHWACDGTFAVTPPSFYQLFTVHYFHEVMEDGETRTISIPVLFALLPNKRRRTYNRLFTLVRDMLPEQIRPSSIMSDFEQGIQQAAMAVFGPNVDICGCLFHFVQCLLKRVTFFALQVQ